MNPQDILSIQMEYHFGLDGKRLLKEKVNAALDDGEWHENFDIAVTGTDLGDQEAQELLKAVVRAYPDYALDLDELWKCFSQHLPQAAFSSIEWLIGPDCALVITDSLRVAKITTDDLVWVTPRISWDGVILDRVEEGVVFGSWDALGEWRPLRLRYSDGKLLEGEQIKF
jgi:hypothetical protein